MPSSSQVAALKANNGGAVLDTRNEQNGSINSAITRAFRTIFHRKSWVELSDMLGLSERVAKHRLAGSRDYTAEELAVLLRSEHGLTFLSAIMANSKAPWWVSFKGRVALADARRLANAARRQIQEAIDADTDLAAAIERAEAFQDSDFTRPHSDALRSMARVPDRALAASTKRRR